MKESRYSRKDKGGYSRFINIQTGRRAPHIASLDAILDGRRVKAGVPVQGGPDSVEADGGAEGIRGGRIRDGICLVHRVGVHNDGAVLRVRLLDKGAELIVHGAPSGRVHLREAGAEVGLARSLATRHIPGRIPLRVRCYGGSVDNGTCGEDGSKGRLTCYLVAVVKDGADDGGRGGGVARVGEQQGQGHLGLEGEGLYGRDERFELVGREDQGTEPGVKVGCSSYGV